MIRPVGLSFSAPAQEDEMPAVVFEVIRFFLLQGVDLPFPGILELEGEADDLAALFLPVEGMEQRLSALAFEDETKAGARGGEVTFAGIRGQELRRIHQVDGVGFQAVREGGFNGQNLQDGREMEDEDVRRGGRGKGVEHKEGEVKGVTHLRRFFEAETWGAGPWGRGFADPVGGGRHRAGRGGRAGETGGQQAQRQEERPSEADQPT